MNITSEIMRFEDKLGFPVQRRCITLDMNEPHDESFAYSLCLGFYGNNHAIDSFIEEGNRIIHLLLADFRQSQDTNIKNNLGNFYALVGNLYYMTDRFEMGAGYFMKSLSYTKEDITPWIELLFSIRAMGFFDIFENAIFNFSKVITLWQKDTDTVMTQQKVEEIIGKATKKQAVRN